MRSKVGKMKEHNENEAVPETENDSKGEEDKANQNWRVGKQLGLYTTHDSDAIQAFIEEKKEWKNAKKRSRLKKNKRKMK